MKIYIESQPDSYVGEEVSVTIHTNTKGKGLAEELAHKIVEWYTNCEQEDKTNV